MSKQYTAWLIEHKSKSRFDPAIQYWAFIEGGFELVADANKATHFSREEDAKGVMEHGPYDVLYPSTVEEHMWPQTLL